MFDKEAARQYEVVFVAARGYSTLAQARGMTPDRLREVMHYLNSSEGTLLAMKSKSCILPLAFFCPLSCRHSQCPHFSLAHVSSRDEIGRSMHNEEKYSSHSSALLRCVFAWSQVAEEARMFRADMGILLEKLAPINYDERAQYPLFAPF